MLNILALLLFFFLLTSAVMIAPGTGIELPMSSSIALSPAPTLVVTVTRDNLIFFHDRRYKNAELPQLRNDLDAAAKKSGIKVLTLKADKQVSYDLLVQIADAATSAGMSKVNLATRPLPDFPIVVPTVLPTVLPTALPTTPPTKPK